MQQGFAKTSPNHLMFRLQSDWFCSQKKAWFIFFWVSLRSVYTVHKLFSVIDNISHQYIALIDQITWKDLNTPNRRFCIEKHEATEETDSEF